MTMGRAKDRLYSLFRRAMTKASPVPTAHEAAATPTHSIFEPPLPYASYDAYTSESRQYITTDSVHVYKSFPSETLLPLEDEGLGRLKNVYEAWFSKTGSMSRDKVCGIYILTMVNTGSLDGTTYCGDTATSLPLEKHYVQCLYSGTGVRRACCIGKGGIACTGAELWIKSSLPVAGPWIQFLHIPPSVRLNKMCPVAVPKPNFSELINPNSHTLTLLPPITVSSHVFELDSDVYVYICRLAPCATVSHTAAAAERCANEPPVFKIPQVRRTATTLSTNHGPAHTRSNRHKGRLRSVYVHVFSDYSKAGAARQGGARLMLPGAIQLSCGDGIHLMQVAPSAAISIKNIGYDRAQFVLIDMPADNRDDTDARSV
ncbi:hypothetical protein GGI20_003232 [Coemansia sp. BCRC 34301]|nr:hypothetical protein GGI20_003232 [Coemansia sp. BCRC 34301]